MSQKYGPLPEFDNPPVSEVALSVQFVPLAKWTAAHGGLFWAEVIADYPQADVQPPLVPQVERFGEEYWQRNLLVEFGEPGAARFWFVGDPPSRLIQVQRDRLIANWRKVTGHEIYPRYVNEIRPRFEREWGRFKRFILARGLGEIEVRQCDVTYVNDIPQGEGWKSFSDLPRLFAPWSAPKGDQFLPTPETLSLAGSFEMPDERGRLYFATQHLRRAIDNKEVIQLRLTARGKPTGSTDADVLAWMDLGREWVVRGFADLTTAEAHRLWGRFR
jgi:uncharacterized protein (TIGR04255 family)